MRHELHFVALEKKNHVVLMYNLADFVYVVLSAMPLFSCGVVWCGVVWCGVVWCGVAWRGVAWRMA